MIIAIDFDGTLCEHKFPLIGPANVKVVEAVKKLKEDGHKIILWTCRSGQYLNDAVLWCKSKGIIFDSVNDDVPEIKKSKFGKSKSQKVFANLYVDDRNLSLEDLLKL